MVYVELQHSTKCWVQPFGSFYWVVFNIFTQVLGYFFKPKCWVQLVGSFYWVIFNIFTQVLGHFNTGLFFVPNRWVDPVSGETQLLRARAF